ncbi:hypothetical protein BS78_01G141100 [Paspalum vaginatum]|nr:hypothetical protein BS78_01G141100 [Paspalum vaginatum]
MAPSLKRRRFSVGNMEQYQEICCLGEGGFGAVFKARDRETGRAVAIKHVDPVLGSVHREASMLEDAGRDNPFVIAFHGMARYPDSVVDLRLVMECGGQSLSHVLRQLRLRPAGALPLPEPTVCAIMRQLLMGAQKMHDNRVIHRDIKPGNIVVSDDFKLIKFCDFGLAMHMNARPPYNAAGTRGYMAPEMLLGKRDYGAVVDTWSLGCVMAEIITGRKLFQGVSDDDTDQLRAILYVLGAPDETTWPWFSSTEFATNEMPKHAPMHRHNFLRMLFPDTTLSDEGFQVLSGLLTCNPDKRLTAAAALKHPWFAKNVYAPEQPKKEVPWPKRRRIHALF